MGNALSPEQVRELASQVVHGIPVDLSVEDYNYWTTHGSELNRAITGVLRRNAQPQAVQALLKLVATATLPAIKTFRASDYFKVGERDGVKIGRIGDNFQRVFGNKVEQNVAGVTLRIHELTKGSRDLPIIAELGGEEVVETTLGQVWEMLKAQGHGQKGKLLVNGYANIFYIRASDGVPWAVGCGWGSGYAGWAVAARPFAHPLGWDAGRQVVSR